MSTSTPSGCASAYPWPTELRLIQHASIEEIERAFWAPAAAAEGLDLDDLMRGEQIAITDDGQEIVVSAKDQRRGMEMMGCWGFATEDGEIHAWISDSCPMDRIMHMLAHEIAHRTGVEPEDDIEAEMRAEQFGAVAAAAFRMLAQIEEKNS